MSEKVSKKFEIKTDNEGVGGEKYILQLFISSIQSNSSRAVINIKAICEKYLKGRYELEIIDIYEQPALVLSEEIIAIPLLIKRFPLPEQRMIGDLSDTEKVLRGLQIIYRLK